MLAAPKPVSRCTLLTCDKKFLFYSAIPVSLAGAANNGIMFPMMKPQRSNIKMDQEEVRHPRRQFLQLSGGAAGISALAACHGQPLPAASAGQARVEAAAPTPAPGDVSTLNVALNLNYLEAQFYSFASSGAGLSQALLTGVGAAGAVQPGRRVAFADTALAGYAAELASDAASQITSLRTLLGSNAAAQPALDISADADGAFSTLARLAGVASETGAFDPYLNDQNFALAAYMFEDVCAAGYRAALSLVTEAASSAQISNLLAAATYRAGLIRTTLNTMVLTTPSLKSDTAAIATAQANLDGTSGAGAGLSLKGGALLNIEDASGQAITFNRSIGQVTAVLYLQAGASKGGFYPNGLNIPAATTTA